LTVYAATLPDETRISLAEIRATNIVWHEGHVKREARESLLGQRGVLVWLTGLPSSGKSTIAFTAEHALIARGRLGYVLDGDNIRHGLNKNLGFSAADRAENIRRIGEVGKLFADAGLLTLTSFVSPYRQDRDAVRALMGVGEFVEVFIDTPLALCEQRDPKGLYQKARAGQIPNFTGISDPYEPPLNPELVIATAECTPEEAAGQILDYLERAGKLAPAVG
jgi:adenylylsulfate kinase